MDSMDSKYPLSITTSAPRLSHSSTPIASRAGFSAPPPTTVLSSNPVATTGLTSACSVNSGVSALPAHDPSDLCERATSALTPNSARPTPRIQRRPRTTDSRLGSITPSATTSTAARTSTAKSTGASGGAGTREGRRFLTAIAEGRGAGAEVGMCFCDLRTSEVILCQIADSQTYVRTLQKLNLYDPIEIIVPATLVDPVKSKLIKMIQENLPSCTIIPIARRYFNDATGLEYIKKYIIKEGSPSLLLGIPTKYYCLSATAALMRYIEESHNAVFLSHSIQFKYQICQGSMVIDCATARNLELTTNILRDNDRETLFGILNETSTSMGARLLRSNILQPLTDEKTIATRLDCVQELCGTEEVFMNIKRTLKTFTDIDRLITSFVQVPSKPTIKHSEQNINHIINLKHTLRAIGNLTLPVRGLTNRLLCTIHRLLTDARLEKFADLIDGVVEQSVVLEKTAVGLRNQRCFAVKAGCNGLLDVARQTYKETINDIFGDVNRYVDEYGIHLKVEFNLTMGYYLSTSVDNLEGRGLPPIFINVIRKGRILTFTTLELVKRNAKVNDSLTEVYLMSDKIIAELSSGIRDDIGALYKVSEAVAMLDMLMAFTHLCTIGDYVRPEFSSDMLVVKQGRHPIIEKLYSTPFVANDTFAGPHNTFHIITGPNMSGKSTYLKQIALLTIMAQIGCYVPAEYASFRIMDQLFSRICNDDSIELNSSTFMIEMKETTYILQNVTEKSLVVIDELGRGKYTVIKCAPILLKVRDNPVEPKVVHETGTSIYDGLGIAFAVCEELIHTRAFIFFTTHFQELTYGLSVYHNVVNLHLDTEAVCDSGDTGRSRMVYKYRVTGGVAQKEHYGVLLAQSLGLPQEITLRAEAIAQRLSDLQENARQRSESDKVVSRRRSLARVAHDIGLVRRRIVKMEQKEILDALQAIQQMTMTEMLALQSTDTIPGS